MTQEFRRRPGERPTRYPVACTPQAWAAAVVFLLLEASLGLGIRAEPPVVCFTAPLLSEFLREVWINNLRVGAASADLRLLGESDGVRLEVLCREGDMEGWGRRHLIRTRNSSVYWKSWCDATKHSVVV